jgi:acyl carrier protein
MNNIDESLQLIFSNILGVNLNRITDEIKYNSFENWDSLRHLQIVAAIEEEYNIELSFEDITSLRTFKAAKEITKKYLKGQSL